MLARLWWKEYRVFGPVWLVLVLASGLLEWLFLSINSQDARTGALTVAALCWAVLYAFASGAAAFSGERESKTLGFLDALPVPRGGLWLGKVSFAMASTFALALVLGGMAALGTESRDSRLDYAYSRLIPGFGTLLLEAVAWSLLWSSVARNTLLAGVMGVLSVFASFYLFATLTSSDSPSLVAPAFLAPRLLAALAALAVSGVVMTRKPPSRSPKRRRERAPSEPAPVAIRASSTGRSLTWQVMREGWATWLLVALVGLVLPYLITLLDGPVDGLLDSALAVLICVVAGVSVFGIDNSSTSRSFLVHHGVRPGTVWGRKVLVWGLVVGSIFGLSAGMIWRFGLSDLRPGVQLMVPPFERLIMVSVVELNAFAVGLLCGMTITRRITAVLVGVIALIGTVPLQIGLVRAGMVPIWSVALVPSIFVAVSRAWAADWLFEREGPGPWLRLGTWVVVPLGLLGVSYLTYRALGVPDVGPQFGPSSFFLQAGPITPDQDAAAVYRLVEKELATGSGASMGGSGPGASAIDAGTDDARAGLAEYLKKNQPALELARQASKIPMAQFEDVSKLTIAGSDSLDLWPVERLLSLDARDRQARGDLSGAWESILAEFRLANQVGSISPTQARMVFASMVHHQAVGLAFEWLGAPGQTGETIGRALADLNALPPLPDARRMLLVESSIIERSLDLTGDELAELLVAAPAQRNNVSTSQMLFFARVVAPPWERLRARRIARQVVARDMTWVGLEPYQRLSKLYPRPSVEDEWVQSSWLAQRIVPNCYVAIERLDRELVGRRALNQAIAVVAWKLGHDGKYPESLASLVPGLLDRIPLDPYSGRPFGYIRSTGQTIAPPILTDVDLPDNRRPSRPGQPLLYSVGTDRTDDGGQVSFLSDRTNRGDLIYAIP